MAAADQSMPHVELLQKTWLLDDWIHCIHDILVIHHGPPKKPQRVWKGSDPP